MGTVISRDGCNIAYSKSGSGPPLILVDGAFGYRKFGPNGELAEMLSADFTVYTYDRRGRGDSGDNQPYSTTKEIEDLQALIAEAGGSAYVYGISSGAALALEAADSGLDIPKMALYEAPFVVDNSRKPFPENYLETLQSFIANGQRRAAVKYFMSKGVGLPGIVVFMMQLMPAWAKLKEVAHTVIYDTLFLENKGSGKPLDPDNWNNAKMPVLVISGSKSQRWIQTAMRQLVGVLPDAKFLNLKGQSHIVKPKVLAPELTAFFNRQTQTSSHE